MTDEIDEMFPDPTLRKSFTERVGGPPVRTDGEALPALPRGMKEYEPWGYQAGGRADEGCTVYSWVDGTTISTGTHFPWRLYLGCDFHDDTELRILLPHRIIVVEGQKLDDLRHRLGRQAVAFIQQCNPGIWNLTPETTRVDRIQICQANDIVRRPK